MIFDHVLAGRAPVAEVARLRQRRPVIGSLVAVGTLAACGPSAPTVGSLSSSVRAIPTATSSAPVAAPTPPTSPHAGPIFLGATMVGQRDVASGSEGRVGARSCFPGPLFRCQPEPRLLFRAEKSLYYLIRSDQWACDHRHTAARQCLRRELR